MSTRNQIIQIEPSILVWARESLGLTIAEVAMKLDKDRETIHEWEIGKAFPSLAQLEQLAYKVYKRPLAVFFLPYPPKESTPKQDFRTIPDKEIGNLSPELRLIIRKAKHNQLVLRMLNDNKTPVDKALHRAFLFKATADPSKSAHKLRDYLGITKRLQGGWKNSEEAFSYYRNLIEKNGVYVFLYPLHDVRGFSLMDKEFPVIVLNSGDTANGKIFSLAHELCHILFNIGGVFRDFYTEELKQHPNAIEVFCNKFASEFLLPTYELLDENLVIENRTNMVWSEDTIQKIAHTYKVSREVVLRKLLDLGKTTPQFYHQMTSKWKAEHQKAKEKKKEQKGGPTYHVTNLSHLGKNFVAQVLNNLHNGNLTPYQVADFLNIKIGSIREYEQKVF